MEGLGIMVIQDYTPIQSQIKDFKNLPQIIIGTPDRLLPTFEEKNAIILSKFKIFWIAHVDELFNKENKDLVQKIISYLDNHTQFLVFSDSINSIILNTIQKFNKSPVKILVKENILKTSNIIQFYVNVDMDQY